MDSAIAPVITLVVALVLVFIAWKVLKGLAKTAALVVILGLAAVYVFGGFN
jgi:hypothetical protein